MPIPRGHWSKWWGGAFGRKRSGFEDLTHPHVDALWRVAFRMTGNRETADDLTQETCLRAFRAFDSFEQGTNYKAWIFRILTNLCSDHLRRQSRAPFHAVDTDTELPELVAPSHETPDNHLMRSDFRRDLDAALQALSPELRLVMSLSLLKELSYQEIAAIAECPVGTVRSRISRGRQHLRIALAAHLPNGETLTNVVPGPGLQSAGTTGKQS